MEETDTGVTQWSIRKVKLEDAKPMPDNARVIGDKAMAGLQRSIERFGYVEPIVWNERTGHIVGGHQRYIVLVKEGVEEAMMVVVDLSPQDEGDANVTLNNPYIEGTWDEPITGLLEEIEQSDNDLFAALNMDSLQTSIAKKGKDAPQGIDVTSPDKFDTHCPCCEHGWNIQAEDVSVDE